MSQSIPIHQKPNNEPHLPANDPQADSTTSLLFPDPTSLVYIPNFPPFPQLVSKIRTLRTPLADPALRDLVMFGGPATTTALLFLCTSEEMKKKLESVAWRCLETLVGEEIQREGGQGIREVVWESLMEPWGPEGEYALSVAVENQCTEFLSSARVKAFIEHINENGSATDPRKAKFLNNPARNDQVWRMLEKYLESWKSPRRHASLSFLSTIAYLILYTFLIFLPGYENRWPKWWEWIFYFFVFNEMVDELREFLIHTENFISSFIRHTIIAIPTLLLLISFILRIIGLFSPITALPTYLEVSFVLVCLSAPLLYWRLIISLDFLESIGTKAILVSRCFRAAIWIIGWEILIIFGFWSALWRIEMDRDGGLVLLDLINSLFGTPQFELLTRYHIATNAILLIIYLFATTIFIGSLLVASFIHTYIIISPTLPKLYLLVLTSRCLKNLSNPLQFPSQLTLFDLITIPFHPRIRAIIWMITLSPFLLIGEIFIVVNWLLNHLSSFKSKQPDTRPETPPTPRPNRQHTDPINYVTTTSSSYRPTSVTSSITSSQPSSLQASLLASTPLNQERTFELDTDVEDESGAEGAEGAIERSDVMRDILKVLKRLETRVEGLNQLELN